jgi:ATP-dependent protease ClpP protease subunit
MENKDMNGLMDNNVFVAYDNKKITLNLHGTIDDELLGFSVLHQIRQHNSPDAVLEIRINTPGGYVNTGLSFINMLQHEFPGKNTVGVIDSVAYSMGAMIFMACHNRVIYPSSSMLLHTVSAEFTGGKIPDILDHSNNAIYTAKYLFNTLLYPYFSLAEIDSILNGREYYLTADEMIKRKMVDFIIYQGQYLTRKEYKKKVK